MRLIKALNNGSPTRKNFLTLVSGTTIAQVFSLIFYPILSRLFTPDEFGLLGSISTTSAIVVVLASCKYEAAIIIAKSRRERINLLALILLLAVVFCVGLLLIMFLFSDDALAFFNLSYMAGWIYVVPPVALSIVIYNCFNEWYVKDAAFSSLATNKIINSGSVTLSKYLSGILKINGGLVIGDLIGRGISALSCIAFWIQKDKHLLKHVTWKRIKQAAKVYIDFPRYTLPDSLLNVFTGCIPIFFLASFYGETSLGYYVMTINVMSIPFVFVGQAVNDIFRNQASNDFEKLGNCKRIYTSYLRKLLPLAIIGLLGISYFLPYIFSFVLGAEWRIAGEYAQILAPAIAIDFIRNSFMSVWVIAHKLKERFWWQVFYFLIMLVCLLVGCFIAKDVKTAIICISVAYSTAYLVSIYYTWKYSKGKV